MNYCCAEADGYSHACHAFGENHERAVVKKLLGELSLEGVLIKAVSAAFS